MVSVKFLLAWILIFFNDTDIKKITNPTSFKNETQQLQRTVPKRFWGGQRAALLANLNKLFLFLQKSLLQAFNDLNQLELEKLEKLNAGLVSIPFSEIRTEIQKEKEDADATTLPILENFEKTIQLLEKIAFETKQLSIEKQPDYEEVIASLIDEDIADSGTIVRGKKAFFQLFD